MLLLLPLAVRFVFPSAEKYYLHLLVQILIWSFIYTGWSVMVALVVAYPCFRLGISGHYFALLTLALPEFVRLCIVGLRDYTGGSLGTQPKRFGDGVSLYAMQFEPDRVLSYYVALALWAA